MQPKDYVTITISMISLIFAFASLLFTFLNYRRNLTKIKIEQLQFAPNSCGMLITPNKLFLNRKQSLELWTVAPMLHLVLYLRIDNLSYTGITIRDFIINDKFLVSRINTEELQETLSLYFFASGECCNKELKEYGHSVPMSATDLEPNDYSLLNIGSRIESKSSIEGVIIVSGSWELYNAVNDGINKLTIATPDKKFDTYIEIDKTIIPNFKNNTKIRAL